jgi:Flp pilus assembly protein TadD
LVTARQAFDLFRAGRMAEAAALCEQVIDADPTSIEAWHLLGAARLSLGQTQDALTAWIAPWPGPCPLRRPVGPRGGPGRPGPRR